MFLNDQETAVDLLYYEAIAKTVVRLIGKTSKAPVTIGVHGDWGAGKSSVLKMTEAAFADDTLSFIGSLDQLVRRGVLPLSVVIFQSILR